MGQAYSLIMMGKVIVAFFVLYVIIPSRIIRFEKENCNFLDRLFISMIHCILITILVVYLLAYLNLYETFSIIGAYILIYLAIVWQRERNLSGLADAVGIKLVITILDMSEKGLKSVQELRAKVKYLIQSGMCRIREYSGIIRLNPLKAVFTVLVLSMAAYVRFHHAVTHFYLGTSDSYVVMTWTKYLGSNTVFNDGIYPYGIQAVFTVLHKVFFIDPYFITRFIGPLFGFLIVLSLYYVLKKNFQSTHLVLLAVFIYGTMTDSRLLIDTWRQISALPMEFAMVFFLPGLHYLNMFFKTTQDRYLYLAGECAALTVLIHPYVTVYLGVGYAIICALNFKTVFTFKVFKQMTAVMSAAIFIGFLPLLVALLQGQEFDESLGYAQSQVSAAPDGLSFLERLSSFREVNPLILIFLFSALILLAGYVYLFKIRKDHKKEDIYTEFKNGLVFILIGLVFYILLRAKSFGLPQIMDARRIGIFFSLFMITVFALLFLLFDFFIKRKKLNTIIKSLYCLVIVALIWQFTTNAIPQGDQMEYDEAAYNYINIRRYERALNWTIIAPVEQYQQSLGSGWHYEIWKFIQIISDPKSEELKIPTDLIFLFVEKIPLRTNEKISINDAQKEFPEIPVLSSKIYDDGENRRIIEAKAYYWAQEYMRKNDKMTVYFENEKFIVYKLEQDGANPLNLLD